MARRSTTGLFGRRSVKPDPDLAAQYDGAMHVARETALELEVALVRRRPPTIRRALHERIDRELAHAASVALALRDDVFVRAGGDRRAHNHPTVVLWEQRANTALNLRSQHQLAEFDDAGVIVPAGESVRTRAAYGPHQAGMDFDTDPEGEAASVTGSTASPARAALGIDLAAAVEAASGGQRIPKALP